MKNFRELFTDWLSNKPEDEVVGYNGLSDSCPLRNFLSDTLEPGVCDVGRFEADIGDLSVHLPEWAEQFVAIVDAGFDEGGQPIRAEIALSALREAVDSIMHPYDETLNER